MFLSIFSPFRALPFPTDAPLTDISSRPTPPRPAPTSRLSETRKLSRREKAPRIGGPRQEAPEASERPFQDRSLQESARFLSRLLTPNSFPIMLFSRRHLLGAVLYLRRGDPEGCRETANTDYFTSAV